MPVGLGHTYSAGLRRWEAGESMRERWFPQGKSDSLPEEGDVDPGLAKIMCVHCCTPFNRKGMATEMCGGKKVTCPPFQTDSPGVFWAKAVTRAS